MGLADFESRGGKSRDCEKGLSAPVKTQRRYRAVKADRQPQGLANPPGARQPDDDHALPVHFDRGGRAEDSAGGGA